MLSCYFFGYHYEHHESPQTPWWKLYQIKNRNR
jgi:beta-carotene ketolase (CrtW type)